MTTKLLLLATLLTAACGASPAPSASHDLEAQLQRDTRALASRSLGGSSLHQIQLLGAERGRAVLAQVVACALPRGASLTVIDRDGLPHAFNGETGLAPGWTQRPATPAERQRVTTCVVVASHGGARA